MKNKRLVKVISFGFPMKIDLSKNPPELCGFWSYFVMWFLHPIEAMINGRFEFYEYNGPYLIALYHWLFDEIKYR